jgi:outer membrane protein assembly factor BamA
VSASRIVASLAGCLVAACGGAQHAGAPAAADRLGGIRIEGNRAIASPALERGLALYQAQHDGPAVVDPYLVSVDTDRIRAAYLRRGFFAVTVATRIDRDAPAGPIVVFAIAEGPRALTRVEIAGLPRELTAAAARAKVALPEGAPFDYDTYEAAKQPLIALLRNAGYAHADVRGRIDSAAGDAHVHYELAPGPRCTFGQIRIAAPIDDRLAAAVRARLQVAPGDQFATSALEDSQAELYALGRFSTVQLVPDLAGDAVIDVAVELALTSRHEVHAGGGLGYDPVSYEVHGRGGGSWIPAGLPLLGLATDARVTVTMPHDFNGDDVLLKLRGLVSVSYLDLFRPRLRGELEVGADYQTVEAYTWAGEHVRIGASTPLGVRWLTLRAGWVLEQLQLEPDPGLDDATRQRLRLDRDQRRGAYEASIVADLRDDPFEPRRGLYVELRAARGTRFALGQLDYWQVTPDVRGYLALGEVVVAARARFGAILGEVPVTERYYSGGTAGQRGFAYRRLSPMASVGDHSVVVGGAGLIETGLELRRRIGELWAVPIGANLFLDGGDVADHVDQLDPTSLYWAVGAGAWGKLIGDLKLRVDLGYRLNDRGPDDPLRLGSWSDNLALHIGIGEAY